MKFFKEDQFNNQTTVDWYMKKYNPNNAGLWFNVKTWLASFTKQLDKQQALNIMNPFNFEFPNFGYDWQVHAYKNKKDSPDYSHPIKSESHEGGFAIDFASNNGVATYSFFRYLRALQLRGAKFRILISLHNHHIHIDNMPKNYGYCGVEHKSGGVIKLREWDEFDDNDVRKHYNVTLIPEEELPGQADRYFGFKKGEIITGIFLLLAVLLLLKNKKNGGK